MSTHPRKKALILHDTPIPRRLYTQILNVLPILTVDVLFFNKEKTKTLLFKRSNEPLKGVYFSIGGRLLKNEKILDCAVRQALREAGIHVNKKKLIFGGIQEEAHQKSMFGDASYHAIDAYYGYVIDEKIPIQMDSQHSDSTWFPISSRKIHHLMRKKMKNILEKI